jgi:hypothetical protein
MARSNNDAVKNLIKDVKDDPSGVKYVYLTPSADDESEQEDEIGDKDTPRSAPEKTVNSMAKSALAKRS